MDTPAKLTASAPVLLVKDVVKAANHYRDAMGFAYERFWGEPPAFVILHRDGMYVMLKQAEDPKHVVPHWTVSDKLWNIYSPSPNTSQLAARMKVRRTLRSLGEGGWKGFGEFCKDTSELCSEKLHFWVSDVDALHAEFVRRGAKIDYGLCDQPYGCREFGTQDLDGHDIGFGQPVK